MADKYTRTNFMPLENVNGNLERDMVNNNWSLFEIKRAISFETIKRVDLQRPDIFSLRIYGSMGYWWILSKVNNIDDWWNDVKVGQDIIVPDMRDIEDFYLKVKANIRK